MAENKTKPTQLSVADYVAAITDEARRNDANTLLSLMQKATNEQPKMWGPSIIGFGTYHYKYETGREGDMPVIGFSPRKPATVFYGLRAAADSEAMLEKLGKHTTGKGCVYIKKLADVDQKVLATLIKKSVIATRAKQYGAPMPLRLKASTIDEYIGWAEPEVRTILQQIRQTIHLVAPAAEEVISYAMPAFRQGGILVYFAAFKNHIGLYPPVSGDATLMKSIAPYAGPKGNLQFPLDQPIPYRLIERIVKQRLKQVTAKSSTSN